MASVELSDDEVSLLYDEMIRVGVCNKAGCCDAARKYIRFFLQGKMGFMSIDMRQRQRIGLTIHSPQTTEQQSRIDVNCLL